MSKKEQLQNKILKQLEENMERADDFHGYYHIEVLVESIFVTMFEHKHYTRQHHYDRTIHRCWDTFHDNYTAEEKATYYKIKDGMIKANVIILSKSGKMFRVVK